MCTESVEAHPITGDRTAYLRLICNPKTSVHTADTPATAGAAATVASRPTPALHPDRHQRYIPTDTSATSRLTPALHPDRDQRYIPTDTSAGPPPPAPLSCTRSCSPRSSRRGAGSSPVARGTATSSTVATHPRARPRRTRPRRPAGLIAHVPPDRPPGPASTSRARRQPVAPSATSAWWACRGARRAGTAAAEPAVARQAAMQRGRHRRAAPGAPAGTPA
eukprot:355154-Chlamydomonas_euryale.AAC.2